MPESLFKLGKCVQIYRCSNYRSTNYMPSSRPTINIMLNFKTSVQEYDAYSKLL